MVRILHVADVHCNMVNFRRLFSEIPYEEYDIVAMAGDLECDSSITDTLSVVEKPVFFVPGNMDDVGLVKLMDEIGINIDGKIVDNSGYFFAGIGGLSTLSSLNTVKNRITRDNIDSNKLIVLAHYPPRASIVDKVMGGFNAGLRELRDFIESYKPRAFLHGHIHESPGHEFIGRTLVVNSGPLKEGWYALVDVENLKTLNKRLRQ